MRRSSIINIITRAAEAKGTAHRNSNNINRISHSLHNNNIINNMTGATVMGSSINMHPIIDTRHNHSHNHNISNNDTRTMGTSNALDGTIITSHDGGENQIRHQHV
jgi:hypothetical protein